MTEPLNDKQIDRLIADYLAGSLSDADRPAFEDWLRASPEHPRRVARLSVTDYCMHEVCQDTKSDYLLDILNQIDDAAGPVQPVTLHHLNASPWHRYRLHAIWGAIAAALLLGMVLTAVLLTGSDAPVSQEIADNTPPKPAESAQPILRDTHVATLTAQHNATWAERASAPGSLTTGSKLHPNQRLTLTAGFAEITTAQGAVAILEAPATIEFTHNDNALELHSGKLVGICETDSSKGFVVKTDNADVVDLGTRFGVAINDRGQTLTEVVMGSVEVLGKRSGLSVAPPVRLTKGQSLALDNQGRAVDRAAFSPALFEKLAIAFTPAVVTSGQARWSAPRRGAITDDSASTEGTVEIFNDFTSYTLTADLPVTLNATGKHQEFDSQPGAVIPAGSEIHAYVLLLNAGEGNENLGLKGSVTFEGEILGVITNNSESHPYQRLTPSGSSIRNSGGGMLEGLAGRGEETADYLLIHEDRRTLDFKFYVAGSLDAAYVLVRSTPTN